MDPEEFAKLTPVQQMALLSAVDPVKVQQAMEASLKAGQASLLPVMSERERQIDALSKQIEALKSENQSFKQVGKAQTQAQLDARFAQMQNEFNTQVNAMKLELQRQAILRDGQFTDKEASLIKGSTPEELTASAELIKALRGDYETKFKPVTPSAEELAAQAAAQQAAKIVDESDKSKKIDLSVLPEAQRAVVEQALALAEQAQSVQPPAENLAGSFDPTVGVGHQFLNLRQGKTQGQVNPANQIFNAANAGNGAGLESTIKNMSMADYQNGGQNTALAAAKEMLHGISL
jgi:hypothetical protein